MVAIVTLVFSLCWLPITLYIISSSVFEDTTAVLYYFKMIAHSISYLNSAINPIIYAFLNRSFRNNCENILTKPTCSLFCWKNYQEQQQNNNHQQLTNYYSKERQNIIIDNNIQLSLHDELNDDFSDVEYEATDPDCFRQRITNNPNDCSDKQYRTLLIDNKITSDRLLSTSL
jgi:hypothetical protein